MSLRRQLILIIELYNHYDVYDYLRQIALTLCSDKVSEVRWISYKLVSERRHLLSIQCRVNTGLLPQRPGDTLLR